MTPTWGFSPYDALAKELNFGNERVYRMRRIIAGIACRYLRYFSMVRSAIS
jgi:hypothetical protein